MVPYVYPSYWTGSYGGDDFSTFIMDIHNSKSVTRARVIKTSIKYGTVPTKLVDETPWNKICVYLIGPYKICSKGKEPLILNPLI